MKIAFHTLGCRLNQSETASLENLFSGRSDYKVVYSEAQADIVVINTCTVTEGGDTDTRRLVKKVNRLNPQARIALVGCQAQVQKEQLAGLTNVRWIVGNQRKMDLAAVFDEHPAPAAAQVVAPVIERTPFTLPVAGVDRLHRRANLKIQDGCDFFCSFCEIPYARGRARSRVFSDILTEARALVAAGHQELILTGINVGTYAFEGKTLLDVIDALDAIEGLARIRISSIEPTTIPLELLDRMGQSKLCRYLHIPLQSGDDDILRGMKRKYTVAEFEAFINEACRRVPGICIGTDVIVGFPGETDAHFNRTVEFLRDAPVHYIHVFSYSPRHHAQSRLMDVVPQHAVYHRSRVLRDLSSRKRSLFYASQTGTVQTVLGEEKKGEWWLGVTDNFVRVGVRSEGWLRNTFFQARLGRVEPSFIQGEILDAHA